MIPAALLLAAAVLATPSVPAGPHQWSVEMLDGSPAATATLFDDVVISPGRSFTSGYLIPHSADITGPLDISAEPLSAPDDLESDLSFAFGVDGAPGPTARLTDLLRGGRILRVADALPAGAPRLDVTVSMDSGPTTQAKLQEVRFRFLITLSDQTIVVPAAPPATPASGLASTGVDPPILALLLAVAALLGAGAALLAAGRRRPRPGSHPAAILARWSPPSTADTGRRRSPS